MRLWFPHLFLVFCLVLVSVILGCGSESPTANGVASSTGEFGSYQLEAAEQHFLRLLGLKQRPRRKRRSVNVPDYLWQLYRAWAGNEAVDIQTNVVRVVYPETDGKRSDHADHVIRFDLKQLPRSEKIRKVELLIHKPPLSAGPKQREMRLRVKVYLQWKSHHKCSHGEKKQTTLVASRRVDFSTSEWAVFNVTTAVQRWLLQLHCVEGMVVKGISRRRNSSQSFTFSMGTTRQNLPFQAESLPALVLHFDDGSGERTQALTPQSHKRVKRYMDGDPELPGGEHRVYNMFATAKREVCRRRPMYLNFDEVGWNEYIIAPAGYDVYFCGGLCPKPLGPHMNTTNHAVVQNQVNSFDPNLVPPPCCVPTALGDITFLFLDENNQMTLKAYKNMVALGCGCR